VLAIIVQILRFGTITAMIKASGGKFRRLGLNDVILFE
jgi:hypothetical protein